MLGVAAARQLVGVEQLLLAEPGSPPRRGTGCRTAPRATAGAASAGPGRAANASGSSRSRASEVADRLDGRGTSTSPATGRGGPPPAAGRARRPTPATRRPPRRRARRPTVVVGRRRRRPRGPAPRPRAGAATSAVWCVDRPGPVGRARRSGLGVALVGPVAARLGLRRPSRPAPRRTAALVGRRAAAALARGRPARSDETTSRCRGAGERDVRRAGAPRCARAPWRAARSASMSSAGVPARAPGRSRASPRSGAGQHGRAPSVQVERVRSVGNLSLGRRRRGTRRPTPGPWRGGR